MSEQDRDFIEQTLLAQKQQQLATEEKTIMEKEEDARSASASHQENIPVLKIDSNNLLQRKKSQTASLASPVDTERPTASPVASPTASPQIQLEIGSRVANRDPNKKSYNWHGTIIGFRDGGVDVRWQERRGMKGGEVLWHRNEDLRSLF